MLNLDFEFSVFYVFYVFDNNKKKMLKTRRVAFYVLFILIDI